MAEIKFISPTVQAIANELSKMEPDELLDIHEVVKLMEYKTVSPKQVISMVAIAAKTGMTRREVVRRLTMGV